jgi:Spy/CpxP family protein refolding chaperone
MKTVKKIIVLVLAISLASVLQAQSNKTAKGKKGEMYQELGLTKEQGQQLKTIHQKYDKEFDKVKDNSSLTKEQKKESLIKLREQKSTEVKAILTEEQFKKWEAIKEEKKEAKVQEKTDDLKKELGITDEQATQLKAIHEKYKPQFKAIKDDTTKTEEQKKAALKTLKEAEKTELKTILSEEQLKKWETYKNAKKK